MWKIAEIGENDGYYGAVNWELFKFSRNIEKIEDFEMHRDDEWASCWIYFEKELPFPDEIYFAYVKLQEIK